MKQIEFNTSRIRLSQQFQHRQYQGMTIDVSIEVSQHNAEPEEIIAEGVKVIQAGFGLALWEILKRYDDGKSDAELQQMVNAIIPLP